MTDVAHPDTDDDENTKAQQNRNPQPILRAPIAVKAFWVAFNSRAVLLQHIKTVLVFGSCNLSGFNKEKITLSHLVFVEARQLGAPVR